MSDTTLYRLYGTDETLLYIGIAGNPGRRWEQHRSDKPWWGEVARTTLEHFVTREDAARAELDAIRKEQPMFNIIGSTGGRGRVEIQEPIRDVGPYAPTVRWKFNGRERGSERSRTTSLQLYWELNRDPISDDWFTTEITAFDLLDKWLGHLRDDERSTGMVNISWFVDGPDTGVFECAPFVENVDDRLGYQREDFLSFYTWPYEVATLERLNWLRVPVVDKRWNPDQGDKGGFIQEALGWKPTLLQTRVHVPTLLRCAGRRWPQ